MVRVCRPPRCRAEMSVRDRMSIGWHRDKAGGCSPQCLGFENSPPQYQSGGYLHDVRRKRIHFLKLLETIIHSSSTSALLVAKVLTPWKSGHGITVLPRKCRTLWIHPSTGGLAGTEVNYLLISYISPILNYLIMSLTSDTFFNGIPIGTSVID